MKGGQIKVTDEHKLQLGGKSPMITKPKKEEEKQMRKK